MSITYKRLSAADASVLTRVADDVFDEAIDPARTAAYLASPDHLMLVAIADGVVIAQVAAVIHRHPDKPTELYIDEVGVTPAYHRRGIARAMMAEMFAWGKSLGCEEAWVGTEIDNGPARRLYETLGAPGDTFVMYEYEI